MALPLFHRGWGLSLWPLAVSHIYEFGGKLFVCSECGSPVTGRADIVTCSPRCRSRRYRRVRDARIRREAVHDYVKANGA